MAAADVEFRCFVGGLAWATTEHSLEQAFSQYGQVVDSKIINDRETGRSTGFRFVTFRDEQSMKDAIDAMNGQDLDGRSATVNEAQSRGGGGSGGGGQISTLGDQISTLTSSTSPPRRSPPLRSPPPRSPPLQSPPPRSLLSLSLSLSSRLFLSLLFLSSLVGL